MLALNISPATETTLPRVSRYRVWSQPELRSHSLAAVSGERLYLAASARQLPLHLPPIAADIEFERSLGTAVQAIDLNSIQRLTLDLTSNTVEIATRARDDELLQHSVHFTTSESADTFFTRLWQRLGSNVTLVPYSPGTWRLMRLPCMLLFGVLFITAIIVAAWSVLEDLDPQATAWLSTPWICAMGGMAAAAVQVWLYRRLTTPPTTLELIRAKGGSRAEGRMCGTVPADSRVNASAGEPRVA
jgi:hypothetical protein